MAIFQVLDSTRSSARCRSCNRPITWFVMAQSGRRMPFDGEVVYVKTERRDKDGLLVGFVDGSINPSHFATCDRKDQWRRQL